jgi:hypothetical protein
MLRRQRDVYRLFDEYARIALSFEFFAADGECIADGGAGLADPLPGVSLRGWR